MFCGSSPGSHPRYAAAARELGALAAAAGIGIVYGGGRVGLMGVLADAAISAGGDVDGVIPGEVFEREVVHRGVTRLHEVESMAERKTLMIALADAFVVLPGGFGTFDELFEIVTLSQLGIARKPVVVLDLDGYFRGLRLQIDDGVSAGFIRAEHAALIEYTDTCESAVRAVLGAP